MEAILYETCKEHGLRGLGVNVFGAPDRPYICVYVHWGDDECSIGTGQTFDKALDAALSEMAVRRADASLQAHQTERA